MHVMSRYRYQTNKGVYCRVCHVTPIPPPNTHPNSRINEPSDTWGADSSTVNSIVVLIVLPFVLNCAAIQYIPSGSRTRKLASPCIDLFPVLIQLKDYQNISQDNKDPSTNKGEHPFYTYMYTYWYWSAITFPVAFYILYCSHIFCVCVFVYTQL